MAKRILPGDQSRRPFSGGVNQPADTLNITLSPKGRNDMPITGIFENPSLLTALAAWLAAQILKPPVEYLRKGKWKWGYLFSAGGMPSSHSSLMVGATMGIGLHEGFNTAVFALAIAMTMIVIYDATGIRRQAGKHAELINAMINDLAAGNPLKEEQLAEVLGHTPIEALGGLILGVAAAQLTWMVWAK